MMKPITDELLIQLAGEAAFKRGFKLFEEGKVLSIEPFKNHFLGTVQGSKTYEVDLLHSSRLLQGSCNCPASDGVDFCKHCVAVALHLKQATTPCPTRQKGAKKSPKTQQIDTLVQYFKSLTKPDLEKQLLQMVSAQPDLRADYLIKAETHLGMVDFKALRKKLTAALPYGKERFYYDQVRSYFAKVDRLIEQIEDNAANLTPEELLMLGEYGLERLNRALETIDDSGGFRLMSEDYFKQLILENFLHVDWSADRKIGWLAAAIMVPQDIKPDYVELFNQLDEAMQQQLVKRLLSIWTEIPKSIGWESHNEYDVYSLQNILVRDATCRQDWVRVIDYYEKTAKDFYGQCQQLKREIEFKLYEQAETRLATLKKQAKDSRNTASIYPLEARLAKALGQPQREKDSLWQLYLVSGHLQDLQALISVETDPQQQQNWLTKAEQHFQQKLKNIQLLPWYESPVEPLVTLYLHQNKNAQAYQLVCQYPSSEELWHRIARHPQTAFKDAWHLYRNLIEREVGLTNNKAYKRALGFIKEAAHKARNPLEQQRLEKELQKIRETNKRKINFSKWFDELLPSLFSF